MVVRAQARRAVVLAAGGERRPVEGVHVGPTVCREGDVQRTRPRSSWREPQCGLAILAEAHAMLAVHDDRDSKGCEGGGEEALAGGDVRYAEAEMIEHD